MGNTFERQQELNIIRNGVMGKVCAGLTTTQLSKLNPNLIAAAPDMYEALQSAYRWYYQGAQGDYRIIGDQLKQALAKAEGK